MIEAPAKKIILRADARCPCGSGKIMARCHLDVDGRLRRRLKSLRPPGPETGFSHHNCYLRDTRDCSEQISREHYISKAVLAQLGSTLRVSGMPWLEPGQTLDTSVASLTAKILCKRHNEALSPLDGEAALFLSILRAALIDLRRKTISRKPIIHLASGDALELWMVKVACGLYFATGSKDNRRISETHTIDLVKVRRALFDLDWESRAGLYFLGDVGARVNVQDIVEMSPLSLDSERRFCGARISLHGYAFDCLFDTAGANSGHWTGLVRRPTEFVLKRKQREHHIIVTWPPGNPERSITLQEP
jgi:hypothetical protein